ncbi:MAG: hypothetical protein ABID45_03970 [Patescibacteria group bacterium]
MIVQVKAISSDQLHWPLNCAICAKEITPKNKDEVNYCSACEVKRDRLEKIEDKVFTISLLFGVLGFVGSLIGIIKDQGHHSSDVIIVFIGGFFSMVIAYIIIRLLILPIQLIFHSKISGPGLKYLKSKESGILRIKFKNLEYANKFKKINN